MAEPARRRIREFQVPRVPRPRCASYNVPFLEQNVGITDLLTLLDAWGTDPGGPPDFDGDGFVGILDLLTLLANWGACA